MTTFVGVVLGIVGLGVLILVHELGHFLVAKATGMRVEEFSLGFGPYLVKRRWGETVYGISAVPLGGYVRVTGMHEEEFEQRVADLREEEARATSMAAANRAEQGGGGSVTAESVRAKKRRPRDPEDALAGKRALSAEEIASTPLERRYYSHPLWHKLLFIVAGVAMNMVLAFVIFYALGVAQGEFIQDTEVSRVAEGSPAEAAGIEVGDRIIGIAGKDIEDFKDLRLELAPRAGDTVTVVVLRDGREVTLENVEIGRDEYGAGQLGVWSITGEYHSVGVWEGFAYAGRSTGEVVSLIFNGIGWMVTGDLPVTGRGGVAGPVGIVQYSASFINSSAAEYFAFLALISVNLALLNMLPLLPLDGGHFVVSIVEKIRRRRVSLRVFERISMVGFALIMVLFLVAVYNDFGRLINGL